MSEGNLPLSPAESAAVVEFLAALRPLLGDGVHEVRLFGSRARGEGSEDSDVDLAVIVTAAGRARRHEIYDLAFDIGMRHRVLLAPTVVAKETLDRLRASERRFAADLEREGIVL